MTRLFILIISILSFSYSYGQYNWNTGKLILKNGDTLKGLMKIPMSSGYPDLIGKTKLEYKINKKGKKKKFDKNQVDKVYFGTSNPNLGYYEYVPLTRKKMALFKLIRNGKVKLYTRTIKIRENPGIQDNGNSFNLNTTRKVNKIKEYYMIRENENVATRVFQKSDGLPVGYDILSTDYNTNSIFYKENIRTFKNYVKEYFSDCADVISFIDNDLYEDFDIAQIIDDYNLICD
jgi:hypothetical protein